MKNRIFSRLFCLLLVLTLLLAAAGCASSGSSSKPSEPKQPAELSALMDAMLAADNTLPEMDRYSSEGEEAETFYSMVCGLEYDKVDGYQYACSVNFKLADEISVTRLKSVNDAAAAEESIRQHLLVRQGQYENYAPEQVPRVKKAVLFTHGAYVVLIVSDQAAAVKQAFENLIG